MLRSFGFTVCSLVKSIFKAFYESEVGISKVVVLNNIDRASTGIFNKTGCSDMLLCITFLRVSKKQCEAIKKDVNLFLRFLFQFLFLVYISNVSLRH